MIRHHSSSRVLSVTIEGPVGPLEASVRVPDQVLGASVVAHPHPLYGGTMHTKVVHRTARLLAERLRLLSVRFNFRGVGASAGQHDDGRGEVDDLLAAVRFARDRHPGGHFVLAGFSFGSVCAIRAVATAMPAVLLLIGVPLSRWELPELENLPDLPVVIVQGENDEFGSPEALAPLAERHDWDLRVVPSADHFFTDRLDRFEEVALAGLNAALAKTV